MSRWWCAGGGPRQRCPLRRHPVPSDTSRSDLCPPRPVHSLTATRTASIPLTRGPGNIPGPHVIGLSLQRLIYPLAAAAAARERASVPWQPLAAAVSGGAPRERTAGHWIRPWANVKPLAAQGQRWTTAVESTVGRGDDMWAPRFDLTGPAPCPVSFLSPPHVFECFA